MSKAIISCWSTTYWTCRTCSSCMLHWGRWRVKRAAGYASRRRQGSHRPVDYGQAAASHVRRRRQFPKCRSLAAHYLDGADPCRHRCGLRQCGYRRAGWQPGRRHAVYQITITPETEKSATISGTTRAATASTQTSRNSLQRLPAPPLARRGYLGSAATQHR